MRVFVALELPGDVRIGLGRSVEPFRGAPSVRWVPETNYHLTIRFLGQVPAGQLDDLTASLAPVAAGTRAVRTSITGFGSFPLEGERARVLWAGVDDGAGHISELATDVRAALARWVPPDTDPYRPHITLGRCLPPHAAPDGWASAPVPDGTFSIRALSLFRSYVRAEGPTYERLHRASFLP